MTSKPTRRNAPSSRGRTGRSAFALALCAALAIAGAAWAAGSASADHGDGAQGPNASLSAEGASFDPQSADASVDPAPSPDDWNLVLVNRAHPLPKDFEVAVEELEQGFFVDARCIPDAAAMLADCRAAGLDPFVCSAYRSQEYQEGLFDDSVQRLLGRGYSLEEARAEAGTSIAVPGTSEHQLGLALDIVDFGNQNLDESQMHTPVQQWLMEHSWEYGFILRYPEGTSATTGIIFEPWHYRYVGREAAREIRQSGLCFEDYHARLADQGA